MRIDEFDPMIKKIYTMFGKSEPSSKVICNLFESCKDIPASAIPEITSNFESLTELRSGVNIVKLIQNFYTPTEKGKDKFFCNECMNEGGFWGIQQYKDGSFGDFFSPCPQCTKEKDAPKFGDFLRRGAMVMPPNYKKGIHRWAKEKYNIELYKTPHHTHED